MLDGLKYSADTFYAMGLLEKSSGVNRKTIMYFNLPLLDLAGNYFTPTLIYIQTFKKHDYEQF